jgi:hypothetical protein
MDHVLFARVGWMRWYRGPQADDEKPIGGGKYNKDSLGYEAFNFMPFNGSLLAFVQPPMSRSKGNGTAHITLEKISRSASGDALPDVTTVFLATHPDEGGQRIVGWFKKSTIYRYAQSSQLAGRHNFSYFIEAAEKDATLVPAEQRNFEIPRGKGGIGQSNVCYPLNEDGSPKQADWMKEALAYVGGYRLENPIQNPESESDPLIAGTIASSLERAAGFQSNPRIRKAIENYAMGRAEKHLTSLGLAPRDTHKNNPYDFLCRVNDAELFVEVKGMQDDGRAISLTPREVNHAKSGKICALFIVHSVKVKGKRKPQLSGGTDIFFNPWDISTGILEPRGYTLTLSKKPEKVPIHPAKGRKQLGKGRLGGHFAKGM